MRRRATMLILLLIGVSLAQVIEKPVPFDSTGKMMVITGPMRQKLGLFAQERQLLNARLWMSPTGFTLEYDYADGSRELTPLTEAQVAELRDQVNLGLPAAFPNYRLNQGGRGLFLLSQIPMALGWYSPALLFITKPNNFAVGAGIYTLGAAAFYFGPMLLTRHQPISDAQAATSVDYGIFGVADGFAITTLLGMGNLFESGTANAVQARWGIMLATSVGGQVFGYYWGRAYTLGQARYAALVTDCGIGDGALLGTFVQSLWKGGSTEGNSTLNAAMMLAGTAAGTLAARRLARQRAWTEGQYLAIGTASILGAAAADAVWLTVAPTSWLDTNAVTPLTALAIAGNIGGTYLAQQMVKETPLTNSAGYIVMGTTLGGTLVGAGLGFLFTSGDNTGNSTLRAVSGLAAAGTVGGFYLGVKFAKDITLASQSQGARRINLDVAALSSGLVGYATRREFSAPRLISFSF